jgi:protein-L-isoaspartate(D-aspartate) O-methyltransferase
MGCGVMMAAEDNAELVVALARRGISDARVLAAVGAVPRDLFVDPSYTESAYIDTALPISCGQTISQPYVVAYMTEKLAVAPDHDVLEIGTGSGYQAAILARLCRHVYTIERHEELHLAAVERFRRLDIVNITSRLGDGSSGWPEQRLFDRIIVTAAARQAPQPLLDQLKTGGRMIVPIGSRVFRQRLVQFDKSETGVAREDLLAVRFVPLVRGEG